MHNKTWALEDVNNYCRRTTKVLFKKFPAPSNHKIYNVIIEKLMDPDSFTESDGENN